MIHVYIMLKKLILKKFNYESIYSKANSNEQIEYYTRGFNLLFDAYLNDIKTNYKDKNILLVTHSGICRILYYYFNGIPEDGNLIGYESTNCSFEKYELEEEK